MWFRHEGVEMADADWQNGYARSFGVLHERRRHPGRPICTASAMIDDTFFVVFNASELDLPWTLPDAIAGRAWVIDSTAPTRPPAPPRTASAPSHAGADGRHEESHR